MGVVHFKFRDTAICLRNVMARPRSEPTRDLLQLTCINCKRWITRHAEAGTLRSYYLREADEVWPDQPIPWLTRSERTTRH